MEFGLNSMENFLFLLTALLSHISENYTCFYYLSDLNNTAKIGDPNGRSNSCYSEFIKENLRWSMIWSHFPIDMLSVISSDKLSML